MKIIDGHMHYCLPVTTEGILKVMKLTDTDYVNLVALYDSHRASETLDCLLAKHQGKGRIYTYGSLDVTKYYTNPHDFGKCFVQRVKQLKECGCDGIKMLEGKPTTRKRYPIPDFDVPAWDPYFAYMEETRTPIVWHVNDPEEFWDIKKVPSWAVESGWFYDETFVNNEDQYRQIGHVLDKHPNLCIVFAHFYFLSDNLDRLSNIFDKYPNVCVDITPGIEMFTNFSKNREKAREFFIKYQDRILYGTDITGSGDIDAKEADFNNKDALTRANLCKDYLAKEEDMYMKGDKDSLLGAEDFILKPLHLSKEIQEKVLSKNFERLAKSTPLKTNPQAILEECEREKERIDILSKIFDFEPNYRIINYIKDSLTK